jgi:hypothetical protein
MNLWEIFSLTLLKFSVGTWLVVLVLWSAEIRRSFYVFNAALAAALTTLVLLAKILALQQRDVLTVGGLGTLIVASVLASALHRMETHGGARLFGAVAAIAGGALLVAHGRLVEVSPPGQWAVGIGFLSGAILLGAVHVTMLLGHWYLVMQKLSFEHLRRHTWLFLGATALRLAACVALLIALPKLDSIAGALWTSKLLLMNGDGIFLAMRLGGGIVLPAVLGLMSYRCVQLRANQAATGLLYLAEVAVLFGEIFASYLLV